MVSLSVLFLFSLFMYADVRDCNTKILPRLIASAFSSDCFSFLLLRLDHLGCKRYQVAFLCTIDLLNEYLRRLLMERLRKIPKLCIRLNVVDWVRICSPHLRITLPKRKVQWFNYLLNSCFEIKLLLLLLLTLYLRRREILGNSVFSRSINRRHLSANVNMQQFKAFTSIGSHEGKVIQSCHMVCLMDWCF